MKWGLLELETLFEENDEYFSPVTFNWEAIPKQWIGKKYTKDDKRSTMSNMNIQIRRRLNDNLEIKKLKHDIKNKEQIITSLREAKNKDV